MTDHTPTPWFHRQAGEVSPRGEHYDWIADSPERGRHRKIIVARDSCDPADYAFIVKAVNSHDALVKALQAARARIEYLAVVHPNERHYNANEKMFLPAIDDVLSAVVGSLPAQTPAVDK